MLVLKENIEKKRRARLAEEEALVEEMKQIKLKRQFLAADASKVRVFVFRWCAAQCNGLIV